MTLVHPSENFEVFSGGVGCSVALLLLPYQENPWPDVLADNMTNSGANTHQPLSTVMELDGVGNLLKSLAS